jgi:hypothetical protein
MAQTMLKGTWRLVHRDNRDNNLGENPRDHAPGFRGVTGNPAPQSDPQKLRKSRRLPGRRLYQDDDKLVDMFRALDHNHRSRDHAPQLQIWSKIPVTIKNPP